MHNDNRKGKEAFKLILLFISLAFICRCDRSYEVNVSEPQDECFYNSNALGKIGINAFRILPLGNSITQAANGYNSWRRPLWFKLKNASYNVDFVGSMNKTNNCKDSPCDDFDADHEGHWGWRTDEIINGKDDGCNGSGKLETWLKSYTPNIALVHLGSNDMFQNQTVASTISELEQIIGILRKDNPHLTVFLAKLIPTINTKTNQKIQTLNKELYKVANNTDMPHSRVILVDQYTGFDAEVDTFDGTHPNLQGEEKMAQNWFDVIDVFLKNVSL